MITRPSEDAGPLAAALRERGVDAMIVPLLDIHAFDGPPLDLRGVQALLVTSANGVRAFVAREGARQVRIFAVGDATARTARAAGFQTVETASGDVAALAGLVRERLDPAAGALVHVAGSKVAGDLCARLGAAGFRYRREVLYEARTADALPAAAALAIEERSVEGIVMYSPRTAATFVHLIHNAGLVRECRDLRAFCLSRAVADTASTLSWKELVVAARPDQPAIVEAVVAVNN